MTSDIIVPDSKPDIVSMIHAGCNPYIHKEELSEGKWRIDGNVDVNVIYLSDNGENKCIKTTLDFSESIEDSRLNLGMTTKYNLQVVSVDVKILNERKLSISVKMKVYCCFSMCQSIEYIGDLENLSGVEKLQETVNINTVVASNTIKSSLKEDISLEEECEVSDILNWHVEVGNSENKISYNKVLSKAEANVKIFYMTTEGKMNTVSAAIPIMNFIDVEKVAENDICEMNYKIRNMNFSPNAKEMKSIHCQVDFEVSCMVYRQQELMLVQDMYGIEKNITFHQNAVQVQIQQELPKEYVNVNENILVEDIRSIYDVDCQAKILQKTPAGNTTNYEGEVILAIYFDKGNSMGVKTAKIPFMVKLDCDTDDLDLHFVKQHFKLNNEDVVCDMELEVCPNSSNFRQINVIDDIEENELLETNNDYAMTVYFAKEGDTIWNIARDFRVTQDSIQKANEFEENKKLSCGEKVYIVR